MERRIAQIEILLQSKPLEVEKKMALKEFILQKHPRNDVEKALAIGYYFERYQGCSSFNAVDVEEGFRNAREKVPDNVADKILKNISKGYMMEAKEEKNGRKAYVLTNSGEKSVEGGFGKNDKATGK